MFLSVLLYDRFVVNTLDLQNYQHSSHQHRKVQWNPVVNKDILMLTILSSTQNLRYFHSFYLT